MTDEPDQDTADGRAAALLEMARADAETREALAKAGALFGGYHPQMRAVHEANADRLMTLIDRHGWPLAGNVGDDAAEAAWLICQHAISRPEVMRRGLVELDRAAADGEAPRWQAAYLGDRVRALEGRLQIYGTQLDWGGDGVLRPLPIEDEAGVDARRAEAGLAPLVRKRKPEPGETPPPDLDAWREGQRAMRVEAGWPVADG